MFLFITEITISIVLVKIKMFIGGLGLNGDWNSLLYRFIILGLTVPNVRTYPIGKAVPNHIDRAYLPFHKTGIFNRVCTTLSPRFILRFKLSH